MTRTRLMVAILLAGAVAVLGLTGCGRLRDGADDPPAPATSTGEDTTEYSWDAQALQSIGFAAEDLPLAAPMSVADPAPSPSAEGRDRRHRFPRLRYAFHRNVAHGEAVVRTEEGTKTVVVQRGTVTAIDGASITVESTDGFTLIWTFGDPLHVVEHRTKIEASAIAVGTAVGVAGARDGDATTARLIVVPRA